MHRRHWLLVGSGVLLTAFFGVALTQEPPGEESVCDVLQGGTTGLYGLCLGYCEAQDCDPDFDAVDPFGHCKPASRKILEKYLEKMLPGDPVMPCVSTPCSCFTADELLAIPATDGPVETYALCTATSIRSFPLDEFGVPLDYTAQVIIDGPQSSCGFVSPERTEFQLVSAVEAVLCRTLVEAAQDDPAVSCP